MLRAAKKPRTATKPKPQGPATEMIKPREWLFSKPQPGARAATAAAARPFTQPASNGKLQQRCDELTRKLAVKSVKLAQVVEENNSFRTKIEELEAQLAATALTAAAPATAAPAAAAAPTTTAPAPSTRVAKLQSTLRKRNIQLEEAKYELEAQNYFDNRARHYAFNAALTRALVTRPMHPGSRYLALRPTLPYRELPEGPVIHAFPKYNIPKRQ